MNIKNILSKIGGVIAIGLIVLSAVYFAPKGKSHSINNLDSQPMVENIEIPPVSKKQLKPLYLEDLTDTVILIEEDTMIAVLKVQVVNSWKAKVKH